MSEVTLDLYGLRVRVAGEWHEVVEGIAADFGWFVSGPGSVALAVDVRQAQPDYGAFGAVPAAFVTTRNVVYQIDTATLVDYFGQALLAIDRNGNGASKTAQIDGNDAAVVREAVANLILSRVGEHLNTRGLVRVHGLGLSGAQGGVVVLLPSGGGKSSLALQALEDPRVKLLSEDTPILDRGGLLHPFPLRLGVNPTDIDLVPAQYTTRIVERLEFHAKLAVDTMQFAERIAREPAPLRHLVVGRRTLGETGILRPLPRRRATTALLREAVVGVGVYQGIEFLFQNGWRDLPSKSAVGVRRAAVVGRAARNARVWQLELGRDRASNWDALAALFREA